MSTINISIPIKLKAQAENLVKEGYYVSFSDLIRDSLRRLIEKSRLDLWAEEARGDLKKGKAVVVNSEKDVDRFLKTF